MDEQAVGLGTVRCAWQWHENHKNASGAGDRPLALVMLQHLMTKVPR